MAQVPKLIPVAPAPSAAANSRVGPGQRVASSLEGPIEEINAGGSVSIDASAAGFDQEQPRFEDALRQQNRDRDQRREAFANGRLFTATSAVFASILERPDDSGGNADGRIGRPREPESVDRIIRTYETNAKVITGTNPVLGTELSISL